jgi:hypothetical protein
MAKFNFEKGLLTVTREPDDPKFYGGTWGSKDSHFMHWLKTQLNAKFGYDLIKKLAYKDGHMVSEDVHYLRAKNKNSTKLEFFFDGNYQIRSIADDWNTEGTVYLNRYHFTKEDIPHKPRLRKVYQ